MPQRILTTLSIDIFRDLRYDTWVLQTIWARMINNARGGEHHTTASRAIFPVYSFLNHSCDPSATFPQAFEMVPSRSPMVSIRKAREVSAIDIVATKDIKSGEEICIPYIGGLRDNLKARKEKLHNWFSGDCMCSRCKAERGG